MFKAKKCLLKRFDRENLVSSLEWVTWIDVRKINHFKKINLVCTKKGEHTKYFILYFAWFIYIIYLYLCLWMSRRSLVSVLLLYNKNWQAPQRFLPLLLYFSFKFVKSGWQYRVLMYFWMWYHLKPSQLVCLLIYIFC